MTDTGYTPLGCTIAEPRADTLRSVELCGDPIDAISTFAVMVEGFPSTMEVFDGQPVPFGVRADVYAAEKTMAKLLLATRQTDLDNPTVKFTFRFAPVHGVLTHTWHFNSRGDVVLEHVDVRIGAEFAGAIHLTQTEPVSW